jgi:phytoene/squalene synthetase
MSQELLRGTGDEAAVADAMAARAYGENFPVALRLLPASKRQHLMAVYGFARMTDDIGDRAPVQDRLGLLDELEADLGRLRDGSAKRAEVRALSPVVTQCAVPLQLFADLIQANRQDQVVSRYPTFDDLLGYCRLSANPVGRIVLHVFGAFSRGHGSIRLLGGRPCRSVGRAAAAGTHVVRDRPGGLVPQGRSAAHRHAARFRPRRGRRIRGGRAGGASCDRYRGS